MMEIPVYRETESGLQACKQGVSAPCFFADRFFCLRAKSYLSDSSAMKKTPLRFCLLGIAFGLLFPVIALLIDLGQQNLSLGLDTILSRHYQNPVLYIVDLSPIVFGLTGLILGKRQQKLEILSRNAKTDLSRFFKLSPDMLCVASGTGYFIDMNDSFERILGYSLEELKARPYVEFVHPDDKGATINATGELIGGNQVLMFENRYIAKDGSIKWVSWQAIPVENGSKTYAIGRDITQKKINEEKILNERLLFMAILESADFSIISTEPDGTIRYFNSKAEKLLGYSAEAMLGRQNLEIIHQQTELDGRAKQLADELKISVKSGFETLVAKSRHTRTADEHKWTYVRKDGSTFPVSLSTTTLFGRDGEINGYLTIGKDITEIVEFEDKLIESERLQREFLEALPLAIFILRNDGTPYYANQRSGELLGKGVLPLADRSELAEVYSVFKADTNDLYPTNELPIVKALNGITCHIEDLVIDRAGEKIPIEVWATPVKDKAGNVLYSIAAFSVIRERKQREAAMVKYAADLEKINKELDQFAYIVSHDLKAPLRAMYLLSEWTAEDVQAGNTSTIESNLKTIQQRAMRMETLIEGILEYSRIGKQNLQNEEFNCDELIGQVLDSLSADKKFTLIAQPGIGKITGKRTLLFQVFSNLVVNAIKYHDKPSGKIEITFTQSGDWIEFKVSDDGAGIEPVYHQKIFGIFQRLDHDEKIEGTGLGLSLVKKIVEGEGGEIRVESALGKGSAFFFTWPRRIRN